MRVTIKGLTDSTIAFNTLGIVLRGNSFKPELYPNSVARHIDIKNDEQMRELISLKNAKLVSFIDEEAVNAVNTVNIVKPVENKPLATNNIVVMNAAPIKVAKVEVVELEEIEDMPSAKVEEVVEKAPKAPKAPKTPKAPKVKTGKKAKAPKATKATKTEKAEKVEKAEVPKIKPIKASKNRMVAPASNMPQGEEDSKIVVMTPSGAITANAVNNMAGDIGESEATRASIEALKQMEEEEAMPESLVDESKLNASDKMGGTAVIATGDNKMAKVTMKNSILPDAESIKKRGVKFINPDGDSVSKASNNDVLDAFIDLDNKDDQSGNDFIEC